MIRKYYKISLSTDKQGVKESQAYRFLRRYACFRLYGVKCHAIEVKKCPFYAVFKVQNRQGNGFIFKPTKIRFYCSTYLMYSALYTKSTTSEMFIVFKLCLSSDVCIKKFIERTSCQDCITLFRFSQIKTM